MLRRAPLLVILACTLVAAVLAAGHQGPPGLATAVATSAPTISGPPAATAATPTPVVVPIPPGYRIRIPRLGIDLPIAEGVVRRDITEQRTPEGYAFHLPGTSIPGEPGNTYLYSHARIGMFLSLWNARIGDEVMVTTPDGSTLAYVVTEVDPRVPATDVAVAEPTPDERLTLQTSTGPDPGDPRFVVVAHPRP